MGYAVKNVKSFMGMDCRGYNASLYLDGKRIANVISDGSGGDVIVDFARPELETEFHEYVRSLPDKEWPADLIAGIKKPFTSKMNADIFLGGLVDEYEAAKWLRRQCKSKTLVRFVGDEPETWRIFNAPFSAFVKAQIIKHNPAEKIEAIANEQI